MKIKKIKKEDLENVVNSSFSLREVMNNFGIIPAGGNYRSLKNKIKEFNININHFYGSSWSKGKVLGYKTPISKYLNNELFIKSDSLKKRLIEEGYFEHKCYQCNRTEWEKNEIPIELHHKDGNSENNKLENLIVLCPNCHAIEEKGKKKTKNHLDKQLAIKIIKESNSVREVLKKCGMSTKSNNHGAIYKLMSEHGLKFKEKDIIKKIKNKRIHKKHYCPKCNKEIQNRSKTCDECAKINQRKVDRPSHEQLLKEIKETNYRAVGIKYGVSDNAIRKWIKYYEKELNK
jgi:hypothetical protein